jgi:hypothetical protein
MPDRYFLHVLEDDVLAEDPEGVELADLDSARAMAVAGGREILMGRLLAGRPLDTVEILISDQGGETLDRVGFADLVHLSGR